MNIILFLVIGFIFFFFTQCIISTIAVKTEKLIYSLFVGYLLTLTLFMILWRCFIW